MTLHDFDKRGVRIFPRYQPSNGKFAIECFRKKTPKESQGDGDWQMIRIDHIQSYFSREEAEQAALKLAEEICKEFKF